MMFNTLKLLLLSILIAGCTTNQKKPADAEQDIYAGVSIEEQTKLAREAYFLKRWNDSYLLHKNILAQQPKSADHWFRLGVSAYRLSKKQEAERYFEQAIKNESRHTKALFNLSIISLGKGRRYLEQYLQVIPPKQRDTKLIKTLQLLELNEF